MKKSLIPLLSFTFLLAGTLASIANPLGEVVAAGSATVVRNGPGSLTVNQATDKVIIDWNSFSIGAGELTRFLQPGVNSAALNRVLGGNPTAIYGMLQANGSVYVINPAGILVGPSGVINTHSFAGSTLDVSDASFLAGVGLRFAGSSTAAVRNEGTISALGGDVFLFAHTVENAGLLTAPNGTIGLAAGSEILLQQSGNERISVLAGNISARQTAIGVNNVGAVQAASAELQAAGGNIYALAINNGGIVRANTVVNQGGRILLKAVGGSVRNSGSLDASSAGAGGRGGDVTLVGDTVTLASGSLVDASGNAGGGTVLVGGGFQGQNPAVPNAQQTTVETGAEIRANAIESGDAGKVAVWANDTTVFDGTINAQALGSSGAGGVAEISGAQHLAVSGHAYLAGADGVSGTLFLDPAGPVTIDHGANNTTGQNDIFHDGWIVNQLNTGGATVTISTANATTAGTENLIVNGTADAGGAANVTWNSANALVLVGNNSISLHPGSAIADSGSGALSLQSGGPIALDGTINMVGGFNLTAAGLVSGAGSLTAGTLTLAGVGDVGASGTRINTTVGTLVDNKTGGNSFINEADGLNLNGTMTGGGSLDVVAGGGLSLTAALDAGTANVLLKSTTLANSTFDLTAANITLENSGALTAGSGKMIATAGTLTLNGSGNVGLTGSRLQTTVGTLVDNKSGGNSFINETDDLNLHGSAAGNLTLTTGGNIAIDAAFSAAGGLLTANSGSGTLTLTGVGDVGASGTRINTTVATLVDNKSGGNSFINETDGLNLSGTLTGGNLDLAELSGATTLNGALNAGVGNVTLSGAVVGGANLLTAGTLTLNGAGDVGVDAGNRLNTAVTSLVLGKSSGNSYLSEADGLNLSGSTGGGNLDLVEVLNGTTLNGALNAGVGNVTLSGGVVGGANLLTAGTLTLSGAGDVGVNAGNRLNTAVTSLVLGKSSGNSFISEANGLNLSGNTGGGNLDLVEVAGTTTVNASLNAGTLILAGGVALNAAGTTASPSVKTTGGQTYGGAVTLGAATVLEDTGAGAIAFNSTVNGAQSLELNTAGTTTFDGIVGGATPLARLETDNAAAAAGSKGGSVAINHNITTTSAQTYNDSVVTTGTRTLTGSLITFNDKLSPGGDSTAATLNINADLTFGAASTLYATLNGTTAGSGYDQITVQGVGPNSKTITITAGATLSGEAGTSFAVNDTLTIINNLGSINVSGQFAQGTTITIAGQQFDIRYNNGGNHDVDLRRTISDWIWDGGGGNNNWTTVANWQGGGIPGNGDTVEFGGTTRLGPINDISGLTLNQIIFRPGAGAFTLGSSPVGNPVALTGGILNNSANLQTINMPLTLAADQIFAATSGQLVFGDLGTIQGPFTPTLNGPFGITLGAAVGGSGNPLAGLIVNAPLTINGGSITTSGAQNYNAAVGVGAATVLNAAAVVIGAPVSAAGQTLTITADDLALNNTITAQRVNLGPRTAGRSIDLGTETAGKLSLTDAELDFITTPTLQVGNASAGDIDVSAALSINPLNASTFALVNNGTINGVGTISAQNLRVSSAGPVSLGGDVNTLSASVSGSGNPFSFADANSLTIGTVDGVAGLTTANGAITLGADALDIAQAINSGTARTKLQPATSGLTIDLGGADAAGTLGLAQSELNFITAGVLEINTAGGINVSDAITLNPLNVPTLALVNGGAISATGPGSLSVNNLRISSAGSVALGGNNTVNTLAAVTTAPLSGQFRFNNTAGLTIGTVDGVAGISTVSGDVILSAGGALAIGDGNGQMISAPGQIVALNSAGVTEGAGSSIQSFVLTLRGSGTFTLNNAANNVDIIAGLVNGPVSYTDADGVATASGSDFFGPLTGLIAGNNPVTLTADRMQLTAPLSSGTARTILQPLTPGLAIDLGGADVVGTTLGLDATDLASVTAGTLQIGAANSGPITVSASVSPGANTLTLINNSTISGAGAITVPNLRLTSAGPVTLNGANDVNNLAADISSPGQGLQFNAVNAPSVGSVDGVNGITTADGAVTLTSAGQLTLNQAVNAGTANVTFDVSAIGNGIFGSGLVTAGSLAATANAGIGTLATPLNTAVDSLEAESSVGGIFINNTKGSALTIGGVSALLNGVRVTGAGAIQLVNNGSILIRSTGENVFAPGDVSVHASGVTADIITGGNDGFPAGAVRSTGGTVSLNAGRDILLGSAGFGWGNVEGANSVSLIAGRDIVVDQFSRVDVQSAGTLTLNANRDVSLLNFAGVSTMGGPIAISTGPSGTFIAAGGSGQINTHQFGGSGANIDVTADVMNLNAQLDAGVGTITLNNSGAASGSGTLVASALDLIGAGNVGTLGARIHTTVDNIVFAKSGGNSLLLENDSVNLQGSTGNGEVDVVAGGGIALTGALNAGAGNASLSGTTISLAGFDLTGANVTLDHSGLATSGAGRVNAATLTLTGIGDIGIAGGRFNTTVGNIVFAKAGGNSFLRESDGVTVQGAAPAIDLAAGGPIGQSGALNISGLAAFKTLNDSGAAITLDRLGDTVNNSFGSISAQTRNAADLANVAADISIHENSGDGTVLAGVQTAGNLTVVSAGPITQSGALIVNGVAKTATFTAAGQNITLGGANDFTMARFTGADVTLNDVNALNLGASTVSGNLSVTAAGAITDSGNLTISGTTSLAAGAGNDIVLDNANDFVGAVSVVSGNNVTLNDVNALTVGGTVSGNLGTTAGAGTALNGLSVGQNLSVVANGPVTDSGNLTISGTTSLAAGAGNDIVLDNANDFVGAVSVVSGNNVTLNDVNALTVGGTVSGNLGTTAGAGTALNGLSVGQNLSVVANGPVTDSGNLTISGTTSLAAGAGNDIVLDNANDFVGAVSVVSGNNVTLNDVNALTVGGTVSGNLGTTAGAGTALNGLSVGQNLSVVANGPVTDSGNLTISGTTSLAAGAGNDIVLDNANDFVGAVSVVSGNNVTLNDVNALTVGGTVSGNLGTTAGAGTALNGLSVGQNLSVVANGPVTDSGNLTISGTTSLAAGAGNDIVLDNANDFVGAVSVVSGNNVTLNDVNALTVGGTVSGNLGTTAGAGTALNGLSVGQNLSVVANGPVTDSGNLTISGTTSLAAGAGNDIVLDNANDFVGAVSVVSGNNVTLNDVNALTVGGTVSGNLGTTAGAGTALNGLSVGQNLSVVANGPVTDSGNLTISGTTSLAAGAGNDIVLDNANDFVGAVSVVSGNNVTLNDVNALTVGGTVSGNLGTTAGAGTALNGLSVGQNLSVVANGPVTDSGNLTISGTTSLAAGAGNDIVLDNANDFVGAVSVVSGNNVTLNDVNALTVGGTVSGNLGTTAGAGTALNGLSVGQNLSVVANGPVTDSGNLTISGTTSLAAGAGNDIVLDNANDFVGAVSVVSGNNVTLNDVNALTVGGTVSGNLGTTAGAGTALNGLSVGQNLSVVANGPVTDSGNLTISGTTSLAAGAGNDIVLDNANDFVGAVSVVSGNNVTLNDVNALTVGGTVSGNLGTTAGAGTALNGLSVGQNLSVVANGPVTDSGNLTISGTTSLAAGAGNDIVLDNANDFVGAVSVVSGNNVTLNDVNALDLGNSTVSGNLSVTAAGAITDSGNLTVLNNANFQAGANPITLDNAGGHNFGTLTFSGGAVTINEASATTLAGASTADSLQLTSGGAIDEGASGTLSVTGDANFQAGGTITLGNPGNDFSAAPGKGVYASGSDITLGDANGFNLGAVNASGTLDLRTAAGDVVQLLDPLDATLGPTIVANTLVANVGGALVLGNLSDRTHQPQNQFGTIGDLTHGTSATLKLASSVVAGAFDDIGLYLFDAGWVNYGGAEMANPMLLQNPSAVLGLKLNGAISGSGKTVIRTSGDLVLLGAADATVVSTTVGDIELSAENATPTIAGNFQNLLGSQSLNSTDGRFAIKAGTSAVTPGSAGRFLVFSTDAKQNFDLVFAAGKVTFHGLGADFLADQIVFGTRPTPILKQNNQPDNGVGNGFVFVQKQSIVQTDESAKFFLDLLKLTVFSGVDATNRADNLPPERPPTIWTSSYHLYLQERQKQTEDDGKKKDAKKPLAGSQLPERQEPTEPQEKAALARKPLAQSNLPQRQTRTQEEGEFETARSTLARLDAFSAAALGGE